MLDRDQVVRAAFVQPVRVLALGVQRVRGDQHAAELAGLVQHSGEHSDFAGLAAYGSLGEHYAGAVVQAGQQVRRGAASGPGAAHGLAVYREHHPLARRPSAR
jgi:hypothetical protein